MKYNLYIQDRNGQTYLEFDSLKKARSELSTRLSLEFSNGSTMSKQGTDDYTVHNYYEGDTHLYIKRTKDTQKNITMNTNDKPLHVHFSIGKFTLFRVFKTKEALRKYVQSILAKGYDAFCMDYDIAAEKILPSGRTTDWNTMCDDIFTFGLLLQKTMANGKKHQIYVSETAPKAPKPKKQKKTKPKEGLSKESFAF